MGMYGYIWVFMGMYVYVWVYMGIYGYVWVYMGCSQFLVCTVCVFVTFLLIHISLNKTDNYGWISKFKVSMEVSR